MQARDVPPETGRLVAGVLARQEQDAGAASGLRRHARGHRAPQLPGHEEVAQEERLVQLGLDKYLDFGYSASAIALPWFNAVAFTFIIAT